MERSRSGCPRNRRGLRDDGLWAPGRALTPRDQPCRARSAGSPRARPVRRQAHPLRALRMEQLVPIADLWACEPVIDRTPLLLGQEGQGCALAVWFLQSGQGLVAGGMVPEQEHRRFRAGPRERRLPSLGPCGPVACARRGFGTLDEAARGEAILHAGATLEVVALIQQDEAQACPEARHRLEQRPGVGVVLRRYCDDMPLESAQQWSIVPKPRQVHCHALLHGGSGEALGDTVAVGLVGQLFSHLGPVIRAVGVLDGRQQFRPWPGARHPAPQQVTGCPHGGGRDVGRREQAPAEPHGHLVGVALVVCGLATMHGFPSESRPEDKREPFVSTQIGEPVPSAQACDSNDDSVPIGGKGLEKRLRTGFHGPMEHDLARLVQDPDVHGPGMQINATIQCVLFGVESPEVSSSLESAFPSLSILPRDAEEGASISINPLELTAHITGFVVVPGLGGCGPQLTGSVRHRRHRQKHSGYHKATIDLSTYIWTEYLQHRAHSRGFDLAIIEHILRFSRERYFDIVTQRMVVAGLHGHRLVMVPYDQENDRVTPVTIHATTRQQIKFRLRTGRFIVP